MATPAQRLTAQELDEQEIEVGYRPAPPPVARTVTVGAAHDPAERDADRLAELALSTARDWESTAATTGDNVHRASDSAMLDSFEIPADALAGGSPGRPLAEDVRDRMEAGFGADFSDVRVHDGSESARLSRGMQARAFTHGSDIHFDAGEFRPGTPDGDRVLAHELAHVVQADGGTRRSVRRFPRTALAGAIDWGALTRSVFRPGEGASGGVYILTSKQPHPDVPKVVVKPVMGMSGLGTKETGEQMVFGDKFLAQMFGISTPVSRVVARNSPEFATLLKLCEPHAPKKPQPQPGEDEDDKWQPLSAAKSFVVMSEVPEGKSIGSMAEKAAEGGKGSADLYRTVFDDVFLSRLGQLCIADLLLGNDDRMVAGAMNLGNIMVSMTGDRPTLFAIDTNAVLDKFNAADIVSNGSTSSTMAGRSDTKKHFANGPGYYLDGFFEVVTDRIRKTAKKPSGEQKTDGRMEPADLIWSTYQANRQSYLASFEFGWQDALITVNSLANSKQGRKQMRGMARQYAGTEGADQLNTKSLQANAMYLGAMAEGKSHEEAAQDPATYAALKQLQQFDPMSVLIPTDDHFWSVARVPSSALSADLDDLPGLPAAREITKAVPRGQRFYAYDEPEFSKLSARLATAKTGAASMGNKSRGVFKKGEQPRNRTLAATFLVSSYQLGTGAIRALGLTGTMYKALETAAIAVAGKPDKKNAAAVLGRVDFIKNYLPMAEDNLNSYRKSVEEAAGNVEKMKRYKDRQELAKVLRQVTKYLDDGRSAFASDKKTQNPNLLLNVLKSAAT